MVSTGRTGSRLRAGVLATMRVGNPQLRNRCDRRHDRPRSPEGSPHGRLGTAGDRTAPESSVSTALVEAPLRPLFGEAPARGATLVDVVR